MSTVRTFLETLILLVTAKAGVCQEDSPGSNR